MKMRNSDRTENSNKKSLCTISPKYVSLELCHKGKLRSKFQTAQVERGLMGFPWLDKLTQLLSVEEKVRLILER